MNELIYEIYIDMFRQGPGDKQSTLKALQNIPNLNTNVKIIDIGCGTGMQTLNIASEVNGKVIGLDNYKPFLEKLLFNAEKTGLRSKVDVCLGDMFNLNFKNEEFDIIWSEGAVYNYGLKNALNHWKKFIKPKGYFVVSEFNWLNNDTPGEVYNYFIKEVPEACTIAETINIINKSGFKLLKHFIIPQQDWSDFYNALEERLNVLRKKYFNNQQAINILDENQAEIDVFRKYPNSYGYVFYVMQKN